MLATPTTGSTAFSRTINQVNRASNARADNADDNGKDNESTDKINNDVDTQCAASGAPEAFAVEALKDCGLPKSFIERMCSTAEDHGTIIEAELKDGSFYVNTCA